MSKKLTSLYPYANNAHLKWSFVEALPNYHEHSVEAILLLERLLIDEEDEQLIKAIREGIKTLKDNS